MNLKPTNNFFNFSERNDLEAIIKSHFSISYKELFSEAKQIASGFLNNGINKHNYIPLLIEDNYLFIKSVIAIWYLGAIPVPLNMKLLDDEINSILNDYNFKFLIIDNNLSFNPSKKGLGIIDLNEITTANLETKIFSTPDTKDEAVVIFTSGSTGRTKGVVHTFSSLINSIQNGNRILNHQEKDRWLASLPFYHIGGFQIICRSLFYGCSIIFPQSLQTQDLTKSVQEFNPTHISLVSTQLQRLIHQNFSPDESLRVSLIGGGFIDDGLMLEADKLGWKPYRVYGSSETGSLITAISADEIKVKPQSSGKAFEDVEIRVSNESEILIKSNSLFINYLGNEKETSSKLINGWYHSGDLGFIDNEGYLFIEARRTDLIVSGGENVNPLEVEKVIHQMPSIRDVCVFPKQNKTWGQIVACALVCDDQTIGEKNIKDFLKQYLAGYKIPKQYFFVDELPRTSLGKLEREKIKKMF
ncbi:MAG: o-succinylbenzoate--CoA ligase [Ignavibacterium sp.]|jgi:O-succinylbenzoic acid--CoA ligase|nr:o-succinylbenzoate--CoA ligase [Ignavibacterium sp.]